VNIKRQIYDIVLKINRKIQNMLKPGVNWIDMERLSGLMLVEGLCELGILKGDPKELAKKHAALLFMPHGLGHFLVFSLCRIFL